MNDDLERPKMQTTEQNSSKLTIQISPSFFLLFFGIVFTLTGLFLLYQSTWTTTFTCHRQETGQGQCELSESTPLGTKTQTISVNEVHGATVERPNISDTGPKSDRVNIITSKGDIPLTSYYGGLEDNYEIADQINAFVSDPSMPTLTIQKGPSAIGYAASSFFIFVGIAAMLNVALCDTYTFDKTTHTMTWTRQGITGSRVRAYSLDQIKGVQSKIVNHSSGSSPGRLIMRQYCRLYLVMTSGKPLHLTRYKLLTKAEAEHYARSIQEILGSVDMHSYEKGASSSSPIDVDVLQKKTPPFQSQPSPSRPQRSRSSATRRIRHMLMAALAFCGVVFVGYRFLRLSQETSANTNSSSPASSSLEHNFELWEWHSDDTVRVVDVIAKEGAIGSEGWTDLLWLRQGDQILPGFYRRQNGETGQEYRNLWWCYLSDNAIQT